ncbi:Retrovirus-related Pol polyprotein from transposon 17.6 [Gossypium australe]|uniref:Retrovirus-related Pol polyprotein from transposon 17.6 n=1 Tax=Gossypium australe TaxID=47621 RepID=A0A5B6WTJ6_9ROSI|nr:Retrovirus-related Pol polyprotein from transposon 17.6 [Gossypium australe]
MLEDGLDIFMDDFSIYEDSFTKCLHNLERKLTHPTNVRRVRNFLGNINFYRRFIKDFAKALKPLS